MTFKPIFATSEKIISSSINNGSFYVATDNGEAYLDIQGNRVKLINTLYDKLSGITSSVTGYILNELSSYIPLVYSEDEWWAQNVYDEAGRGIILLYNPYTNTFSDTTATIGGGYFNLVDFGVNESFNIWNPQYEAFGAACDTILASEYGVVNFVKNYLQLYDQNIVSATLTGIIGLGAINISNKSNRTQTISLSAATSSLVGGVKSGTDISVDSSGNVTVLSAGQVKHDLKFNFTGDTSASTFNGSTDINIYAGLGISFNMGSESDECYIGINKANNSQSYLYVNNDGIGVSGITEAITGQVYPLTGRVQTLETQVSGILSGNLSVKQADKVGHGLLITANNETAETTATTNIFNGSADLYIQADNGIVINYDQGDDLALFTAVKAADSESFLEIDSNGIAVKGISSYVEDSLSAFEDNLLSSYIGEGFSPTSTIADRLNSTEAKLDGLIKVITFTSEDQTELEDYQVLWSGTTVLISHNLGGRVVGSLYDENNHQVLVGIDYVNANTVSINLSGQTLTSQTPYTLILNAGEGGVGNSTDGGFVSAKEMEIVPLTNLEFTPKANKVYTYSVTDGDVIAFSTISNNIFSFRLYLTLPNHLITFNLPSNIIWDTLPNFSQINSLYMFVFEWNPILQKWLGNQLWKPVSIE